MSKIKDITGQKFGRLTVLYRLHNYNNKNHGMYWLCVCDCGNLKEVYGRDLRRGSTRSCGCLHKDKTKEVHTIHGKTHTRLYRIYHAMKRRCYDKHNNRYENYGSRGIVVCDEWKDDFETFYDWAMNNGYRDELTINRIDNNGNYEPMNCEWVDYKTQNRNTRQNRYIKYKGETHCLKEWCEILNLKYSKVLQRIIKLNWPIEKAFTTK